MLWLINILILSRTKVQIFPSAVHDILLDINIIISSYTWMLECNGYIITWILHQIFLWKGKWIMQRAKIPISQIQHPLVYPIPPTGWMNLPINEFHVSNLNWRQFFSCHNIHVYSTSILNVLHMIFPLSMVSPFLYTSFIQDS